MKKVNLSDEKVYSKLDRKVKNIKVKIYKENYFCPKCKSKNVWIADNTLNVTMDGNIVDAFKDKGKCLDCGFSSLSRADFSKGGLKRRMIHEKEERLKGKNGWEKFPKSLPPILIFLGLIATIIGLYYVKTNAAAYGFLFGGGLLLLIMGILFYMGVKANHKITSN